MKILFRDEHCAVVEKPEGMIVHRGRGSDELDLLRAVRADLGRVYPVHRLDRATSGAVLLALSSESASRLGAAFREQRVEKRYLALTRGHPEAVGTVDYPVPNAAGNRVPAVTQYQRLGVAGRYALVELCPKTGRLHQIRRHMKHISCPLIGDVRYGKGEHNRLFREQYGLHRLALHAYLLKFEHPISGKPLEVKSKISGSLRSCLATLGLLDAAREVGVEDSGPMDSCS